MAFVISSRRLVLKNRFQPNIFAGKMRPYISFRELIFGQVPIKFEKRADVAQFPKSLNVDGKFVSPWCSETGKSSLDVVKYLITRQQRRLKMKDNSDTKLSIPVVTPDRSKLKDVSSRSHFTWMGHATSYHQIDGMFFLTDPIWSDRASPSQYFGPKRFIQPPIEVEDLHIDVVLLSHTHYDHLDYNTAKRIGNRALWYVCTMLSKSIMRVH